MTVTAAAAPQAKRRVRLPLIAALALAFVSLALISGVAYIVVLAGATGTAERLLVDRAQRVVDEQVATVKSRLDPVFAAKYLSILTYNKLRTRAENIHAHYDLGNAFYRLWLDPSMNYSSAWFQGDTQQPLQQAQRAKMARALEPQHGPWVSLTATVVFVGKGQRARARAAVRRALAYTTSNPLRWDAARGLIRRPYTIDMWDFAYGPTTTNPSTGARAPRHWIDSDTVWGTFHGDNTGLIQAIREVATLEDYIGERDQAQRDRAQASSL